MRLGQKRLLFSNTLAYYKNVSFVKSKRVILDYRLKLRHYSSGEEFEKINKNLKISRSFPSQEKY
jgi:hypothetical protein